MLILGKVRLSKGLGKSRSRVRKLGFVEARNRRKAIVNIQKNGSKEESEEVGFFAFSQ